MTPLQRPHTILTLFGCALLAACNAAERGTPLPGELADRAVVPGIPGARMWGDDVPDSYRRWLQRGEESEQKLRAENSGIFGREHHYLSISGGGPDGAFTAGLLCGWTEEGSRPEFTMVSGISTGALIAPFAFLGPEYDDELREVYTLYSTEDLVKSKSVFTIIRSDGVADTGPMRENLESYYDLDMLDRIAEESRRGRKLLIGTTNLDAGRPVIWDVGHIAESDAPNRVKLFQDVILASAAIPSAFPPVYFEVEADGARYDEMHVDGGATSQLFLYPIGIDWGRVLDALQVPGYPRLYSIRNDQLLAPYEPVEPRVLSVAIKTTASLMRTGGFGDMYRVYLAAIRDGLDYHLAYIPDDFDVVAEEPFDTKYMSALFQRGFEMARAGYPWDKAPPGVEVD